jgi:hypothetical protein
VRNRPDADRRPHETARNVHEKGTKRTWFGHGFSCLKRLNSRPAPHLPIREKLVFRERPRPSIAIAPSGGVPSRPWR